MLIGDPIGIWPLGAELGEGPIWCRQSVWFVDIRGRRIHRLDPGTGNRQSWDTPEAVGFIHPTIDGDFIVGLKSGLHRFLPHAGSFRLLVSVEPHRPENRLNDAAVDSDGRLWFGSMHEAAVDATGSLYRLENDGSARPMDQGYIVTNGPTFSPDGRRMYHTDSAKQTIYVFDLDRKGLPVGRRVFARIDEPNVYPDGPVVDAEGCLWTGLFGGWGLRRYSPHGELIDKIELPCSQVTKAAFGGPELRTLFITTAWADLTADQRRHQPLAGGLFSVDVEVAGLPSRPISQGL